MDTAWTKRVFLCSIAAIYALKNSLYSIALHITETARALLA